MNPKIVIFGSNGMLGRTLFLYLSKFYYVIGLTRQDFDACSPSNLHHISKDWDENTIIINCIGLIPQKYSIKDQTHHFIQVNSIFPHLLQEIVYQHSSRLIHITTDCVFDGKEGPYQENSPHTEINIYGVSKSCGEPADAMIIRTSIIGEEQTGKKSLLEWVRSHQGKTISGYTHHFWNGLTCLQVGKVIHQCMERELFWKGVKHLVSPEIVSKYELVKMINEVYQLNNRVEPLETPVVNKSLISSLSFQIPTLFTQIQQQKEFFDELQRS